MDTIQREITHATRRLVRNPAFTLATITTLALAIAANVAIFTLVNRVVVVRQYSDSSANHIANTARPNRRVGLPTTLTTGLRTPLRIGTAYGDVRAGKCSHCRQSQKHC